MPVLNVAISPSYVMELAKNATHAGQPRAVLDVNQPQKLLFLATLP